MTSAASHSRKCLLVLTPLLMIGIGMFLQIGNVMGQAPIMVEERIDAPPAPPVAANRCVGDGLQVCRCYCRAEFRQCQNDQVSFSSVPLCKAPWVDGNCSSLAYFQTQVANAGQCAAMNSQACGGYIRPGDTSDALQGQTVVGALLGCEMVALPNPTTR